jgi:hypothetical protein
MHDDGRFRSRIAAEVLGMTLETFDEKAADALEMSRSPSMAAERSAERLLLTGSD